MNLILVVMYSKLTGKCSGSKTVCENCLNCSINALNLFNTADGQGAF